MSQILASFLNSYFGRQANRPGAVGDFKLCLTDGTVEIDLCNQNRWHLLGDEGAWAMGITEFKGGGIYTASPLSDGDILKDGNFGNVTESLNVALSFSTVDNLRFDLSEIEELLQVTGPRYWTARNGNYNPVYLVVKLPNETDTYYSLISYGKITLPGNVFNNNRLAQGVIQPINLAFNRQPFFTKVPPGQTQAAISAKGQQIWYFGTGLTTESSTPSGQVFCFVNDEDGTLYVGGESEILTYSGGSWAAVSTSPVTLSSENITTATRLSNDDILFGSNGRIIKRSAAGVWSVETTEPSGQVYDILEYKTGEVYAADNGRIIKRDTDGTWAENTDLPSGQVYSLAETTSGYILAGEVGQILRTSDAIGSTDVDIPIVEGDHNGREVTAGNISFTNLNLFNGAHSYMHFLYFTNVEIPVGATINTAVIEGTANRDASSSGLGTIKIGLEKIANAPAPINTTNNISNRTLTTAYSGWTDPDNWAKNQKITTPNFATALQEVVDLGGWGSGNNLLIVFYDYPDQTLGREFYTYNEDSSRAPRLKVTYTSPIPAGEDWEINSTLPSGDVWDLLVSGAAVLAADNGQILASQDEGDTWGVVSTLPSGQVYHLDGTDSDGTLYAGGNGNIYNSVDNGTNWSLWSDVPVDIVYTITNLGNKFRAGNDGLILHLDATQQTTLGPAETSTDVLFLANHHREANLTHIFIDDGGSFSSLFPISTYPTSLYPSTPAVNDALYFGCDTSVDDSGPFSALAFVIGTAASATTSYAVTWEYYNGSSWAALTVNDETSQFGQAGNGVVAWELPSDWATTAVNSVTGYWVRARLSALTGTMTVPTQITRTIYSPFLPYAELSNLQLSGSMDALIKSHLSNRSAGGGTGDNPGLYANRVWLGAKAVASHTTFRAFLNFADEQNPTGVAVDVSVDGDSATSIEADSNLSAMAGKRVLFDASAATLNTLADRVSLTIATATATDYYGTYRVFLRCKQQGGSAGDITVRIKVVFGSGGVINLGDRQKTQTTADHHLIAFQQPVTLPLNNLVTASEVADDIQIVVQIASSSSSADLYLYDLFLLPTDTMFIDSADLGNNTNSVIGNGQRLLLDSITIPKTPLRTLVQQKASGAVKTAWRVDSRGPYELPTGRQLRLWMLAARTVSTGDNTLISPPEIVHSLQSWKTERELI